MAAVGTVERGTVAAAAGQNGPVRRRCFHPDAAKVTALTATHQEPAVEYIRLALAERRGCSAGQYRRVRKERFLAGQARQCGHGELKAEAAGRCLKQDNLLPGRLQQILQSLGAVTAAYCSGFLPKLSR